MEALQELPFQIKDWNILEISESNSSKLLLYTRKSSRIRDTPSNAVLFHSQKILFFVEVRVLTATCLPSRKLSKSDEPDMQDTAGEAGMSS